MILCGPFCVLPGGAAGEPFQEVLASVLELVAVQPQAADQENPHVVFRAPGVVFPAILAGGAFRSQGLRRDRQAKDDVCFDLASQIHSIKFWEFRKRIAARSHEVMLWKDFMP